MLSAPWWLIPLRLVSPRVHRTPLEGESSEKVGKPLCKRFHGARASPAEAVPLRPPGALTGYEVRILPRFAHTVPEGTKPVCLFLPNLRLNSVTALRGLWLKTRRKKSEKGAETTRVTRQSPARAGQSQLPRPVGNPGTSANVLNRTFSWNSSRKGKLYERKFKNILFKETSRKFQIAAPQMI